LLRGCALSSEDTLRLLRETAAELDKPPWEE